MDIHLLKEKSSAYRNLIRHEDALPVYDSMATNDLSQIVRHAREVLIKTARMPVIPKMEKCEERSQNFRTEGNKAFAYSQYQSALIEFNKALCHAPNESHSLKLAYANRSAVFNKIKAYEESIVDIDICMRLGCPPEIESKLKKRHRVCRELGWINKLSEETIPDFHSLGKFFKLLTNNPQLSNATMDVGVAVSGSFMTVVAANNINVGSLIVFESAYVSQTNDSNKYQACSFCHKMALNLVPCRYCCDTLFCGPVCMKLAMVEYHKIECHLSEVLRNTASECRMALKAVVRMRHSCTSWDAFTEQASLLGKKRVGGSVAEVFGEDYPFTLLCKETEKPFVQGPIYNAAIDCAVVLYYLDKLPFFLPKGPKRKGVLDCIARVMMHLSVYHTYTQMQAVIGQKGVEASFHNAHNYGWFPLISKLKNSCVPNVIALAVNKEMALVAVQPIKRGTELTVAYLGHWLDTDLQPRARQKAMFALSGTLCSCRLCIAPLSEDEYTLSEKQAQVWRRLKVETMVRLTSETVDDWFLRLSRSLAIFQDLPFSKEYEAIYHGFRRCLAYYQVVGFPQRLVTNYTVGDYPYHQVGLMRKDKSRMEE